MPSNFFNFNSKLLNIAFEAEHMCKEQFNNIDSICQHNQSKVLSAFIKNRVSESHFYGSTGYGYDDIGRDCLDNVFSNIFQSSDSLVRHNFVNGTHALSVALFGVLRPGDLMVSVTGLPYDTLLDVIGINNIHNQNKCISNGSLKDFGINYSTHELLNDGTVDLCGIPNAVKSANLVYIQKSRGYSLRKPLSISDIYSIVKLVRTVNKTAVILVDNCYGEFVELIEPSSVGANLVVGSLIKNPGGGIVSTGGYITGDAELVKLTSYRLTSVGIGKEVGCTLNQSRQLFLGLFMAPQAVSNALKSSVFANALFYLLGFKTYPNIFDYRSDIISYIQLDSKERLISFCEGIQKGSPVDSFVKPTPWKMPGYNCNVIMAAGCFNMGASIELSADAPLKEPYGVFVQGGITYYAAKVGLLFAAQNLLDNKLLSI